MVASNGVCYLLEGGQRRRAEAPPFMATYSKLVTLENQKLCMACVDLVDLMDSKLLHLEFLILEQSCATFFGAGIVRISSASAIS